MSLHEPIKGETVNRRARRIPKNEIGRNSSNTGPKEDSLTSASGREIHALPAGNRSEQKGLVRGHRAETGRLQNDSRIGGVGEHMRDRVHDLRPGLLVVVSSKPISSSVVPVHISPSGLEVAYWDDHEIDAGIGGPGVQRRSI